MSNTIMHSVFFHFILCIFVTAISYPKKKGSVYKHIHYEQLVITRILARSRFTFPTAILLVIWIQVHIKYLEKKKKSQGSKKSSDK